MERNGGDEHDDSGESAWFFAIDPDGTVLEQFEVYEAGHVLQHDNNTKATSTANWLKRPCARTTSAPHAMSSAVSTSTKRATSEQLEPSVP
jgi:hypothetical protein